MVFQREKQNVSASQLLQAIADADNIFLSHCTVTGVLDINRLFNPDEKFKTESLSTIQGAKTRTITLTQSMVFDNCIFEENVVFAGPWAEPESVSVEFKQDVVFNSSKFKGQTRFRNALFGGTASFDGCSFTGVVTLKNAKFHKDAKFRTAAFESYFLATNAVFESSARFANTHFTKGANFSSARFLGHADFNGVYSSSRAVPAYESVYFGHKKFGADESFWRFVKQSALEAGYYQMAGECFYNERCARLRQKFSGYTFKERSPAKKTWRLFSGIKFLPELVFGKMLFGYGERPVTVLVASAIVIIICAFVYSAPDMLVYRSGENQPASFVQGLYFSMITFTTLGYGDLYPNPHGLCRLIAMTEAVAGVCLMALFVVCLAKKFSRG